MPKTTLTSEQKKLIDFEEITPDRHDFAVILFCSRIIVRIQIKCFEETETFLNNDINNIVRKEAESFSERLGCFIDQIKETEHCYNSNATSMDFKDKIASSEFPLINILSEELSSRPRKINPPPVKRLYKNLISLADDLRKYFVNCEHNNKIRPIYFSENYFIYQEGTPKGDDENFISFPVSLVWLPTAPTFRSQLLRMNGVQKRVNKSKMEKKIQKTTKIPKNRRRKYCTSYDDIEYPSIEPIEPPVPMTSIRAILNHSNQLPSVSNWQTTTITETQNLVKTFDQFNFRKLCPCILKE
ncbi:10973_t:CDS:2 [Rhizophagus irregularis]|nr:10973_t:CDS:2 [Rhizophagus irregularis]